MVDDRGSIRRRHRAPSTGQGQGVVTCDAGTHLLQGQAGDGLQEGGAHAVGEAVCDDPRLDLRKHRFDVGHDAEVHGVLRCRSLQRRGLAALQAPVALPPTAGPLQHQPPPASQIGIMYARHALGHAHLLFGIACTALLAAQTATREENDRPWSTDAPTVSTCFSKEPYAIEELLATGRRPGVGGCGGWL